MKPIGLEWLRRFPPARGLFTTTDRQDLSGRLAVFLLLLFAFAAWYKTGLANVALATLGLLFLLDLPGHWQGLRKDPALWLLVAGLLLTTLLAWRATLLFPAFAAQQWSSLIPNLTTSPLSLIASTASPSDCNSFTNTRKEAGMLGSSMGSPFTMAS